MSVPPDQISGIQSAALSPQYQLALSALMRNPQALQQLNAAPNQMKLGQQLYTQGQGQLSGAMKNLNPSGPPQQVNGVAGRTSPFQALGNGLMGGAGLMARLQGQQQQQTAASNQAAGQLAAQKAMALVNVLRQQGGSPGSAQGGANSGQSTGDDSDEVYQNGP